MEQMSVESTRQAKSDGDVARIALAEISRSSVRKTRAPEKATQAETVLKYTVRARN